jgi:3-hydroxymyristoyl/3-hydroxydecanoyl-(acyl carrier protein) dehydratase
VVTFDLDPGYPGFDGHFPGDPILPGMCHLDLAVRAASIALRLPLVLAEAERVRFTRAVRPGEVLRISLSWPVPEEEILRITAVHAVGEESAAELALVLRRSTPPGSRG